MLIASGKRDTKVGYFKYGITSSLDLSRRDRTLHLWIPDRAKEINLVLKAHAFICAFPVGTKN